MKNIDALKNTLTVDYGDVEFSYLGKTAGIEIIANDSVVSYEMWYGDLLNTYDTVDALLDAVMFNGKSLRQIANDVDFFFI